MSLCAKLQTEYVDLLLIHQPFGDYYGTYRAMEEAYRAGKARAIGVSNFYPDRFIDLAEHVKIKPAVNQVETHVFNQQVKAEEIMREYGTQIMSWASFAEGRNNFFTNGILTGIGQKYNKSVAQVALRFLIQRNIVVIPKSTHKERMAENFDVFSFELSEQDMNEIAKLDKAQSLFFSHYDPELIRFILSLEKTDKQGLHKKRRNPVMDHASFILHYYNFRDLFLIIIFLILLVFFLWGFFHEERTQSHTNP